MGKSTESRSSFLGILAVAGCVAGCIAGPLTGQTPNRVKVVAIASEQSPLILPTVRLSLHPLDVPESGEEKPVTPKVVAAKTVEKPKEVEPVNPAISSKNERGIDPGVITVGDSTLSVHELSKYVDGHLGGDSEVRSLLSSAPCEKCGSRQCAPGRTGCDSSPRDTLAQRFFGTIHDAILCDDPCYQPKWEPLANAGFFTDGVRPIGQTAFRWHNGQNLILPDRSEYFWARSDGRGKGPNPVAPARSEVRVNYNELMQLTEIGGGAFSTTILTPYRSNDPLLGNQTSGFSDMQITTKSLLLDTELLMLALEFRTYIPVGNFRRGLGTGHVALEPTLLAGLRLSSTSYLQLSLGEWIPIAGDKDYSGSVLKTSFSYNHLLWKPVENVRLIGTIEGTALTFQDGAYTDPILGPFQKASDTTAFHMGPGFRFFFADKFDIGAGTQFSLTGKYFAREQLRVEFRYRY